MKKSSAGSYDLEQYYAVYANQRYSTCQVRYTNFQPKKEGVKMGCGIRKKPGEENLYQKDGILISSGPEQIRDPENIDDRSKWLIPFIGKALEFNETVKIAYKKLEKK